MGKLRSVNTEFWSDPWIEELNPTEKLLYLYLITNEKTNMLGVYELSIKKISFETGLNTTQVENALKHFERVKKVKYTKNYIVLINFTKHQNYNLNMKKSAIDCYNDLPDNLKIDGKPILSRDSNGFETLCNGFLSLPKVEDESEDEIEDETKHEKPIKKIEIPDFSEFRDYALEKKPDVDLETLRFKYESWVENDWQTGTDKPRKIKNWKTTLLNTLPHLKINTNGKESTINRQTRSVIESNSRGWEIN